MAPNPVSLTKRKNSFFGPKIPFKSKLLYTAMYVMRILEQIISSSLHFSKFLDSHFTSNTTVRTRNIPFSKEKNHSIFPPPAFKMHVPYSRDYKTPLYLFLRLFGASSIQEGLIFKKFLN